MTLRCIALVAAASLVGSAAAQADWNVQDTSSQLDNSRTYIAHLDSTNKMPNSLGVPENATIVVRCKSGKLSLYIVWPTFMGLDGETVKWKFDSGDIWQQDWDNSSDGTATFVRDQQKFLKDMAAAAKLVVDAPPYQSEPIEAVFDLKGANEVVNTAVAACPT
ncbi:MAG TPA: hypothetical protein VMS78_01130 [Rhizomicrobium sp.]|nr:hypothetical protein [Rhizomicrobium sp.]